MSDSPKSTLQLAQFEVIRRLGEGGMAEVFLARKRGAAGTSKLLVVKRVLPHVANDPHRRSLFIDEALVATRLNHPNLTQVYELVDAGEGGLLMSMEYVEGADLGRLMHACKVSGERIPFALSAWIIAEAAKGLHYAHERKDEAGRPLDIVHRDVSPENILLSQEGVVKVTDFGIAAARNLGQSDRFIVGKTRYMAPEQARDETVDRRVDVYALGAVLWELLTGRSMFGSLRGEALKELVRSGVVARPSMVSSDVPDDLERIVLGALAPDRKDRFSTARELSTELGRALVARGAWVDGTELDALMRRTLKTREPEAPEANPVPTEVAVRSARPALVATSEREQAPSNAIASRELRQVSLLAVRIVGPKEHASRNDATSLRVVDQFRTRLQDIAFKRGAEWTWTGELEARATVGLDENSPKVWESAALLAIDVHETVASFLEETPQSFAVSVAIGRGVAEVRLNAKREWLSSHVDTRAEAAASSLLEQVPPGETWTTGSIYRALRYEFAWEPIAQASSGQYALLRALSKEERRARAAAASGDFVGRFAERAELHGALHDACSANDGQGELTTRVVIGERGIGKTALIDAFVNELPPGVAIVRFECTPNHVDTQLRSMASLARAALGATPEMHGAAIDELIEAAHLTSGPYRSMLAKLVHNVDGVSDGANIADDARMMVASVRRLLASRAEGRGLVVVVDQAQWLDSASLPLLTDLLRPRIPTKVFAVLASRPDARIRASISSFVTMPLGGLSHDELIRVVELRLGVNDGVRQPLAHLVPRVDGNPFFMLESVDALLEKGALTIQSQDGRQFLEQTGSGTLELPASVEQVVALRLKELLPQELRAVEWLAVAGVSLSDEELIACDETIDLSALTRLCARGICSRALSLIERRQLLFFEVAYAHIPSEMRTSMHRTLGLRWLARAPEGVAPIVVARHLERGGQTQLAGGPFFAAAEQTRRAQQIALATKYYRRALELLAPSDPRHFEARAALERLLRTLGRKSARIAHLSALRVEARKLGTAQAGALALIRTAQFELDEGRISAALESVNAATGAAIAASSSKLTIKALLLQADVLRDLGRTIDAERALDRALVLCDTGVMGLERAEVLRALGILRRRAGRVDAAIDAYREALGIAKDHKARLYEARIDNALSYAMLVCGRYEETIAYAMDAIRIDLEVGGRFQMAKTLTNLGHAAARLGDYERAKDYLAHARRAHVRMQDEDGYVDTLLVSAALAIEYETPEVALRWLAKAREQLPRASKYDQVHEQLVTSLVSLKEDRWVPAARAAQNAALHATNLSLFAFEGYALSVFALACAKLGKLGASKIAIARVSAIAESNHLGEFLIESLGVLLEATELAEGAAGERVRRHLAKALAAHEAQITTPSLRETFRDRPLIRNVRLKTAPSAVSSEPGAWPSRPIG